MSDVNDGGALPEAEDLGGVERLTAELVSFPPTSLTCRLIDGLLGAVPGMGAGAPFVALPPYTTLDGAADLVFGGLPEDLRAEARVAASAPGVGRALRAARSIDTGDTGLTIVGGVRSAFALFLSRVGPGAGDGRLGALAQQQRTDAALKALALAYVATCLAPLPPADRVDLVRSVPAGEQLFRYYAAFEIALPFADEVGAAGGRFVADLVRDQGRAMGDKLLAIVGRQGLEDAQQTVAHLVGALDEEALAAAPHAQALAERVRGLLPGFASGARVEDLVGLAAAGADALPCYRYLVARLAVESSLALAKHRRMPEVPLPTPVTASAVPPPPPPPVPAGLRTASPAAVEDDEDLAPPIARPLGAAAPVEVAAGPAETLMFLGGVAPPAVALDDDDDEALPGPTIAPVSVAVPPAAGPADTQMFVTGAAPEVDADDELARPAVAPLFPEPAAPPPVTTTLDTGESPDLTGDVRDTTGWFTRPTADGEPRTELRTAPLQTVDDATAEAAPVIEPPVVEPPVVVPPPPPTSQDAPPPPPPPAVPPPPLAPVAWPTQPLPEEVRLRGCFLHRGPDGDRWRVFTVEGVYTEAPPRVPEGVDWNAHRAAGHRVGTYQRTGDELRVELADGQVLHHRVDRGDKLALGIDGLRWPRADWDLTGRAMTGTWRGGDGTVLVLDAAGNARYGSRTCTYTLGIGRILLVGAGGSRETLTLLTDLAPSSKHPDRLWLGGVRLDRDPA